MVGTNDLYSNHAIRLVGSARQTCENASSDSSREPDQGQCCRIDGLPSCQSGGRPSELNWKTGLLRLWVVFKIPLAAYCCYSIYTNDKCVRLSGIDAQYEASEVKERTERVPNSASHAAWLEESAAYHRGRMGDHWRRQSGCQAAGELAGKVLAAVPLGSLTTIFAESKWWALRVPGRRDGTRDCSRHALPPAA